MLRKPAPKPVVAALAASVVLIWLVTLASGQVTSFSPVKLKWRYRPPGGLLGSATDGAGGSYLLFGAGKYGLEPPQTLVKLNEHGKRLWPFDLPPLANDANWKFVIAGPDGTTFVGAEGMPEVACIKPDGSAGWQVTLDLPAKASARLLGWTGTQLQLDCGPAVTPQYAVWLDGEGRQLHKTKMQGSGTFRPPATGPDGAVYFRRAESLLFDGQRQLFPDSKRRFAVKLDPTGKEAWALEGGYHPGYSQLAVGPDGNLYAPRDGAVDVIAPDGTLLWSMTGRISVFDAVQFAGQTVYLIDGGALVAVDSASRQRRWTYQPQGYITKVLPASDGSLYCLIERQVSDLALLAKLKQQLQLKSQPRVYYDLVVLNSAGRVVQQQRGTEIRRLLAPVGNGLVLVRTKEFEVRALSR